MPEQERPWVRLVGALILGGGSVAAAFVPLYCAKQNRLAETTSTVQTSHAEIDDLNQRLSQANQTIALKDAELAQLRTRTAAPPDCPPAALRAASPEQVPREKSAEAATVVHFTKTIMEREVEFALQGCHLSGTTLSCNLLITSKGADRGFVLRYFSNGAHSRVIDPAGREVRADRFAVGANHCGRCEARASLPADVPIAAQLGFEGVAPGTKHVQLLELFCGVHDPGGDWHDIVVKFPGFDL